VGAHSGLSESQEDYLEAILSVIEEKGAVRAKDIAARLGVTSPSVTGALRALSDSGLLNYAPYDVITLTAKGKRAAEDVTRRHRLLRDFLVAALGVGPSEADRVACRMEHALSPSVARRLATFMRFKELRPSGGDDWISAIVRAFEEVEDPEALRRCIEECVRGQRGGGEKQASAKP
jgi:DtxR family Mn-dependent transcriptional regulator